jgi:hypothetical protein
LRHDNDLNSCHSNLFVSLKVYDFLSDNNNDSDNMKHYGSELLETIVAYQIYQWVARF